MNIHVRAVDENIPALVAREGKEAAAVHGRTAPADFEGAGDRIVTNVPLPDGAVVVTDPHGNDATRTVRALAVQAVRWRNDAWAARTSRVVEHGEDRFSELRKASRWTPGEWGGEAILSSDWWEFGLPPEANPA